MSMETDNLFSLAYRFSQQSSRFRYKVIQYRVADDEIANMLTALDDRHHDLLAEQAQRLDCEAETLRRAVMGFLTLYLRNDNHDHYQALGLANEASDKQIRSQYRNLIGLFHPDKNPQYSDAYALRINQAYNVLKRKASREKYDKCLREEFEPVVNTYSSPPAETVRPVKKKPQETPEWLNRLAVFLPGVNRYPKAWVWAGVMTVAIIIAAVPYITQVKSVLPGAKEPVIAKLQTSVPNEAVSKSEPELASGPEPEPEPEPDAQVVVDSNQLQAAIEEISDRQLPAANDNATDQVEQILPEQQTVDDVNVALDQAAENAVVEQQAKIVSPQEPVPQEQPDRIQVIPGMSFGKYYQDDYSPVDPALIRLVRSTGSSKPYLFNGASPELVLMQFVQEYETGNLDGLMQLFKFNRSKRHEVADPYKTLFESTSQRDIKVKELIVKPSRGNEILLLSRVELSIHRNADNRDQHYDGDIIFQVTQGVSGLQISGLMHSVR